MLANGIGISWTGHGSMLIQATFFWSLLCRTVVGKFLKEAGVEKEVHGSVTLDGDEWRKIKHLHPEQLCGFVKAAFALNEGVLGSRHTVARRHKIEVCKFFAKGKCRKGSMCSYDHGEVRE